MTRDMSISRTGCFCGDNVTHTACVNEYYRRLMNKLCVVCGERPWELLIYRCMYCSFETVGKNYPGGGSQ